jgi:hypothetical protein
MHADFVISAGAHTDDDTMVMLHVQTLLLLVLILMLMIASRTGGLRVALCGALGAEEDLELGQQKVCRAAASR